MKNELMPGFDMALAGLIADLEQRGLLDDTLVLVLSEHGRTPRINNARRRRPRSLVAGLHDACSPAAASRAAASSAAPIATARR